MTSDRDANIGLYRRGAVCYNAAMYLLAENHGFLPTRGSIMLDVVFVAMFAIVPVLLLSIYLVKFRQQFALHKTIQIASAAVLLIAVVAFEVDVRLFTDWELLAVESPYYQPDVWCPVWIALAVHLCAAIPTPLLWIVVIVQALRRFPSPPVPGTHSGAHKTLGWIATMGMILTAVTGWIFYWMAFVAT